MIIPSDPATTLLQPGSDQTPVCYRFDKFRKQPPFRGCFLFRLWRIPDRRRPGPLLDCAGQIVAGLHAGAQRIPGGPATGGVFQHANIVEGTLPWIELGIAPQGLEFRSANIT